MKIAAISDLHGRLPDNIPKCDLLLIAGDITPSTVHMHRNVEAQGEWLDTTFREWLNKQPAKHIVGICGNHDFVGQYAPELIPKDPWIYLEDEGCIVEGLNIWGSPWSPYFNDWAFNLDKGNPDEPDLTKVFSLIPNNTDILVSHAPPYGILDKIHGKGESLGSRALLKRVRKVKPKLHVYGHIHSARQEIDRIKKTIGKSSVIFANVSLLDEDYNLVFKPQEFEICK